MASADFTTTARSAHVTLAHGLRAVAGWVAARRAARAKKVALQSLLLLPEYRLRDMGICRDDLLAAIDARHK